MHGIVLGMGLEFGIQKQFILNQILLNVKEELLIITLGQHW